VWFGKDIRNQSASCSLLKSKDGAQLAHVSSVAPHLYTLDLFRVALHTAAGRMPHQQQQQQASGAEHKYGDTFSTPEQPPQLHQSPAPAAVSRTQVVVSLDLGVLSGGSRGCGYVTGSNSLSTGLTVEEVLDMVTAAGADSNVGFFSRH
jgi:hypothetical protein